MPAQKWAVNSIAGFLCGAVALATPVAAWAQAGMSMDDFVEYSVQNLQDKIRDLNEENSRIRQKNDALRTRILFLRQQMRDADDRRMDVLAERNKLQAWSDGVEHTGTIVPERTAFVLEKKTNLLNDQTALKESIAGKKRWQEELQSQVRDTGAQIEEVRVRQKRGTGAAESGKRVEADKFRRMIEDSRKAAFELQRQIDAKIVGLDRVREALLLAQKTKSALQDQLLQAQDDIQEIIRREQELRQANQSTQQMQDAAVQAEREKLRELEQYAGRLSAAEAEARGISAKILRSADNEQKILQGIQDNLVRQKSLLQNQLAAARTAADLSLAGTQAPALSGKEIAELKIKKDKLAGEIQAGQEGLARQQERAQKYRSQEQELSRDIAELSRPVVPGKNKALAARKTAVRQAIRDQEQLLKKLQGELSSFQDRQDKMDAGRLDLQNQAKNLQEQIADGQKKLADMEKRIAQTAKDRESIKQNQSGSKGDQQKYIRDLEARKTALANSVSLIQSRYEAESSAVKDFQKEEAKLQNYRAVLAVENEGLKDRLENLR